MGTINNFDRQLSEYAAIPLDGFICTKVLAASTQERVAIPAGAIAVLFSATAAFVAKGGAAAVAATWPTDLDDGTGLELNPTIRRLNGVDTHISVISDGACVISMRFFKNIG